MWLDQGLFQDRLVLLFILGLLGLALLALALPVLGVPVFHQPIPSLIPQTQGFAPAPYFSFGFRSVGILVPLALLVLGFGVLLFLVFRGGGGRSSRAADRKLTEGVDELLADIDRMDRRIANLETILMERRR